MDVVHDSPKSAPELAEKVITISDLVEAECDDDGAALTEEQYRAISNFRRLKISILQQLNNESEFMKKMSELEIQEHTLPYQHYLSLN